ncbi:unnamed protein product [Chondrus crispus]|uniref:Peptidase S1 domain-containing protein n=1 Tax=Chondrus crispus TaxID=2769 RepID=R7QJG7_CHOCR|nr:unnamed protein product [Chondrus crispus]CDF37540.1 unnamed protein product [Chondrus crispus]|eukprot:XP_005717411.1 unnamed protein product [Chondrus crispus]
MRINNNTDFAQDSSAPRFLRVKGYGLRTRPNEGQETLTGNTRPLLFADLLTSKCDDRFGNDEKRRLCTKRDNSCGPCFGDTGAPLYDVDKSGKVSVLVGIVTFGLQGLADGEAESICTSGARATIYTAVAPYIGWIRETVDEDLTEFFIPKEGITNTNLDPGKPGLSVAARTSIIVVASLALIGFIAFLLVTCTLRRLRNRRKRWVEGLHAEESFVKGDEKHAGIADPFEGIVDDHKTPRLSVNSLSRAAVKSATEFSARSIGTIRALLMHVEEEEMAMEPREPMDDAPQWLPDAWEKLFKAPSKKDLEHIHKVKTQRVVDDVLEGGDKSVEPSLDHVAFKNARDEANLEAAWRKLEIQTSLRNLSEASGSKDGQESAPGTVPSTRNNSSRFLSRTSSRGGTHGAFSSILAGNVGGASSGTGAGGATDGKPDTLLAAFASIDAESEQVAEETMIDQLALQALATSKRPKVLETLRRKFSGSALLSALSNKNTESEATSPRVKLTSRKAITAGPSGQGGGQHGSVGRASSGRTGTAQTISALANRSSKPVGGGTPGRTGSTGSVSGLSGDMDRHGSMHIDYFSEDYSFSSSSDEEQPGQPVFNLESASRRFTEDRPDGIGSQQSLRSFRKSKPQSFEKLESRWMDRPDEDEDNLNELPMTEIESIIAEGTLEDNILRHRSWNGGNRSIFTTLSSRGTRQRATDANSSTLENVDNESMVGNHSLDEISEQAMEARIDEELHMTSTGDGSETVTIARLESDVHPVIEQTAYKEENEQLEVRMEQDYDKEKDLARPVQDMTKVSFAEVKAMWNEKVRRASET